MNVSREILINSRGTSVGQAMFCNEMLQNIAFISTHEEVSLSGANICTRIPDNVLQKGGIVPSYKQGYTCLQAIVEAIDWAYKNQSLFIRGNKLYLAEGHSGDYAELRGNKVYYCIARKGCWLAATFEEN